MRRRSVQQEQGDNRESPPCDANQMRDLRVVAERVSSAWGRTISRVLTHLREAIFSVDPKM